MNLTHLGVYEFGSTTNRSISRFSIFAWDGYHLIVLIYCAMRISIIWNCIRHRVADLPFLFFSFLGQHKMNGSYNWLIELCLTFRHIKAECCQFCLDSKYFETCIAGWLLQRLCMGQGKRTELPEVVAVAPSPISLWRRLCQTSGPLSALSTPV